MTPHDRYASLPERLSGEAYLFRSVRRAFGPLCAAALLVMTCRSALAAPPPALMELAYSRNHMMRTECFRFTLDEEDGQVLFDCWLPAQRGDIVFERREVERSDMEALRLLALEHDLLGLAERNGNGSKDLSAGPFVRDQTTYSLSARWSDGTTLSSRSSAPDAVEAFFRKLANRLNGTPWALKGSKGGLESGAFSGPVHTGTASGVTIAYPAASRAVFGASARIDLPGENGTVVTLRKEPGTTYEERIHKVLGRRAEPGFAFSQETFGKASCIALFEEAPAAPEASCTLLIFPNGEKALIAVEARGSSGRLLDLLTPDVLAVLHSVAW